eukprot:6501681-Heterocapsa_arctica.AAC.1
MKSSLMIGGHVRAVMQKDLSSIREAVSTPDTTIQNNMMTTVGTGTKEGRQTPNQSMRRKMTETMAR